jgi:hypothetical protein
LRSIGGDEGGEDCRRLVALFREDARTATEVAAASPGAGAGAGAGDRCIIVIIKVAVTTDFLLLLWWVERLTSDSGGMLEMVCVLLISPVCDRELFCSVL